MGPDSVQYSFQLLLSNCCSLLFLSATTCCDVPYIPGASRFSDLLEVEQHVLEGKLNIIAQLEGKGRATTHYIGSYFPGVST
jgi:hypothetical protein